MSRRYWERKRKNAERKVRKGKDVPADTYEERDALLRFLGLGTYADYLSSPRYRKIRLHVFADLRNWCSVCEKKAEVLHHRSYGKFVLLGGEYDSLVPLCRSCHTAVEYDPVTGRKRSLAGANEALDVLLRDRLAGAEFRGDVVLTADLIHAGKIGPGGWCKAQLAAIGIQWKSTLRAGWIGRAAGRIVTAGAYQSFLALRGATVSTQR